jgi:hypothetical protein
MIAANDTGLNYYVLFFDSANDDADCIDKVGPFTNMADAIQHSIDAAEYAKQHGIPWFPTETIFE